MRDFINLDLRDSIFMNKDNWITLKEASAVSGYSSDYIGQLIRRGKWPGKQVYTNVAWVTKESAVLDYLKKEKNGSSLKEKAGGFFARFENRFSNPAEVEKIFEFILYGLIAILAIFTVILFYIAAVSVDRSFDKAALERVNQNENINNENKE